MISRPLLITLAVTLGLTVWVLVRPEDESLAASGRAVAPAELPHAAPSSARSAPQDNRLLMPLGQSPFGTPVVPEPVREFEAVRPTVPESVVVPPPAPEPPPLPFRYIGKINENGRQLYVIADSNRVYPIERGARITPDYELTQAGDSELVLTYLPLAQTQVLRIEH